MTADTADDSGEAFHFAGSATATARTTGVVTTQSMWGILSTHSRPRSLGRLRKARDKAQAKARPTRTLNEPFAHERGRTGCLCKSVITRPWPQSPGSNHQRPELLTRMSGMRVWVLSTESTVCRPMRRKG